MKDYSKDLEFIRSMLDEQLIAGSYNYKDQTIEFVNSLLKVAYQDGRIDMLKEMNNF